MEAWEFHNAKPKDPTTNEPEKVHWTRKMHQRLIVDCTKGIQQLMFHSAGALFHGCHGCHTVVIVALPSNMPNDEGPAA